MTRTRTLRIVVVALALLGLGWALAPRWAPPVYDGVGFPDEPYRFVVKPSGAADTKAPTTATGSADVVGGQVGAVQANSAEQAPQVSILIPVGRLHAPTGTTRIVITARPVQPVAAPSGGHLWSNVYDISANDPAVTLTGGNPAATIILRAATAQRPYPTIERYTGTGWVKVTTAPNGRDIYRADLPALGRYAVIGSKPLDVSQLNSGKTKKSATSTGVIIAVVAGVVILALIAVAVRRRVKTRRTAALEDAAP